MTTYVTPKKNTAYKFYVGLVDQSNTKLLKANPTIASGDFKVSTDGGAFANLTTLPSANPASGRAVMIDLSSSEMNGDNIVVQCVDAAGAEWCDLLVNIQTTARQIDDLAWPATTGRSMVVDAAGLVDANTVKVGPSGSGTAQTARDIGASVLLSSGTGTGQILLSSGTVTVGTNNDKTGYALTQAFPANFSALAITAGGAVTAGTVSDKTGYTLTQAFPTNFSALAITAGGAVTAGTVTDKTGYSLTQSFPANFASLAITGGGAVTAGTVSDKTGYELSATGSVALTESYRANGATGTIPQLLYEILGNIVEQNNSGTTRTVKKLDHSTTAATYTYDNSTPNTITRAT